MIEVVGLTKIYRVGAEKVAALSELSLNIPRGQICCIVGTSGSGKSTLLNQLAGLEKPTRGEVLIGGKNISAMDETRLARFRRQHIGFVFQSYNLMTAMSALENVAMPLIFRGMAKREREKAARKILKEVGLGERMLHKPSQMSGGQQQRVGIARAFVASPKIIFADEPTGNLDTRTTIEVMRMMVRLSRAHDQTLVLVTHDNEIAEYADRIVTLRDGRVVDDRANVSLAERPEDEAEFFAGVLREEEPAPAAEPDGNIARETPKSRQTRERRSEE
jgi:putative ABC transport system ATP-binding protein